MRREHKLLVEYPYFLGGWRLGALNEVSLAICWLRFFVRLNSRVELLCYGQPALPVLQQCDP